MLRNYFIELLISLSVWELFVFEFLPFIVLPLIPAIQFLRALWVNRRHITSEAVIIETSNVDHPARDTQDSSFKNYAFGKIALSWANCVQ